MAVICCWSSPAKLFVALGPDGTHNQIFVRSKNSGVFGNGVFSSTRGGFGLFEGRLSGAFEGLCYCARTMHLPSSVHEDWNCSFRDFVGRLFCLPVH
jgi:hypothetical protein